MDDAERARLQEQINSWNNQITSYNQSINNKNAQIKNLNERKSACVDFKNDINNNVLPNLKSAKSELSMSLTRFTDDYSSEGKNTKASEITRDIQNNIKYIRDIQDKFNEKIMPSINAKIKELEKEITRLQGEINSINASINENKRLIVETSLRMNQ